MIFFFHHYEMPLILYQDRLQRILTEINTAPPAGPLDVQQVTVSIHTRPVVQEVNPTDEQRHGENHEPTSQVQEFSTQNGAVGSADHADGATVTGEASVLNSTLPSSSTDPVERIAEEVVSEAIDELFLS
ncbi:unnamed protein product [Cylicostephanus goldi]|uniref:Uncharacterized protein n=1 Tax=Cylicostephanus goldi TaxID=71465 RepID=A0A3P6RZC9_CYLGO|nr:unnamed protein product [Cylicostephanus goldi]